jgi:hypothetical protein
MSPELELGERERGAAGRARPRPHRRDGPTGFEPATKLELVTISLPNRGSRTF